MHLRICLLFLVWLIISCKQKTKPEPVSVVPKPVSITAGDDVLKLGNAVSIVAKTEDELKVASLLTDYLKEKGVNTKISGEDAGGDQVIRLSISKNDSIGDEGYNLAVGEHGVTLSTNSGAGLFYGVQTLMQLFQSDGNNLPFISITDYPRFGYRGLHLDVGRHMFPVSFIKKYIDLMARHKMNRFHWHLTEDQGWRIEIKKYPRLQQVAAYRDETVVGRASTRTRNQPHDFDGKRYGGFYTQEEVKEVVQYAADHFITVIPEIELPGHAMAALAAYPELGCTGGPYKTATTWGIFPDVYCAGKENTFAFLQDVFDEIIPLFPSKYVHIGGDEVFNKYFTTAWEKCPHCKKRMKTEKLKDKLELQSYFVQRIEKYLNSKDRQIIGWDEILEGGLAPNATVMSWRGEEGGIAAAKKDHDVIMSPENWFYLDHSQDTTDHALIHVAITPLSEVYSYEPIPAQLSSAEAEHILGAQANVWTEYMKTPEQVEFMTWPRACAVAEIEWSPANGRTYEDFIERMKKHTNRLADWKVNYAKYIEKEFSKVPAAQ
jgi:hexosaminidase